MFGAHVLSVVIFNFNPFNGQLHRHQLRGQLGTNDHIHLVLEISSYLHGNILALTSLFSGSFDTQPNQVPSGPGSFVSHQRYHGAHLYAVVKNASMQVSYLPEGIISDLKETRWEGQSFKKKNKKLKMQALCDQISKIDHSPKYHRHSSEPSYESLELSQQPPSAIFSPAMGLITCFKEMTDSKNRY